MAVKIRLTRKGKKRQPTYRVVVADSRSPRDGRFIEQIGRYDPRQEPSLVEIDNERATYWLARGAQPSDQVRKLLEISGTLEPSSRKVRPVKDRKVHVVGEEDQIRADAEAEATIEVVEDVDDGRVDGAEQPDVGAAADDVPPEEVAAIEEPEGGEPAEETSLPDDGAAADAEKETS